MTSKALGIFLAQWFSCQGGRNPWYAASRQALGLQATTTTDAPSSLHFLPPDTPTCRFFPTQPSLTFVHCTTQQLHARPFFIFFFSQLITYLHSLIPRQRRPIFPSKFTTIASSFLLAAASETALVGIGAALVRKHVRIANLENSKGRGNEQDPLYLFSDSG